MPGGNKNVTHTKLRFYLNMCDFFLPPGIKGLNYRNSIYHMYLLTPIVSRKKSTVSVMQLRIKHDLINN